MSTKAIREALERSKRMWRDSDSVREIQAALAEVEAIERAAKTVSDHGIYRGGCETGGEFAELDAAEAVFAAIATQEP